MNTEYSIVGRVGRDVDLRFSDRGVAVAKFTVAVSRGKKVNGEWQDVTVWHDVTCFNETAEHAAESLKKGDEVIAIGYVEEPRVYERKQPGPNGETHGTSLPFVANALGLSLRWAPAQGGDSHGANRPKGAKYVAPTKRDDEPF
jgi:single-strand DNA-binding protein